MTIARNKGQLIIKGVFALFLLFSLLLPLNSLVAANGVAEPDATCTDAISCAEQNLKQAAKNAQAVNITAVNNPPTTAQIIGKLVATALQIIGLVFFLLVVYAGIVWLTAGGNKERADKAVSTLRQATLALLVIIFAYIVVNFVVLKLADIATSR